MYARPDIDQGVGIIFPSGMLGGGFTAESIKRGIAMGATAIAIDAGSTDSGPYYLGAGVAKTSDSAVARAISPWLRLKIGSGTLTKSPARFPVPLTPC